MDTLAAEQTTWFQDTIEYAGPATARFATPEGTVTGLGRVQVMPNGEFLCTLECQDLSTESELPFGWIQFFENGSPQVGADGVQAMALHTGWNTCTAFRLETAAGVFEASSPIHFNYTVGGDGAELRFRFPRSEFIPQTTLAAAYWVLPLWNFVSEFSPSPALLSTHPLRVWVESPIDQEHENRQDYHKLVRWSNDRVIPFVWEGAPAFIERVPEYGNRIEQLQDGKQTIVVTAIMVGEIGDVAPNTVSLEDWRVLSLLSVLSLACGNEVRASWVELRASGGELIRRIHFGRPAARFRSSDNVVTGGAGALLSGAPFSTHFGKPHFRACVRHLIQSGGDGSPLEDRLDHLSRALEMLCRVHGFNTNAMDRGELPESARDLLADAKSRIEAIAQALTMEPSLADLKPDQKTMLKEVGRRLTGAFTIQVGFGKAVEALVKYYGLMDSAAVAEYYRKAPHDLPHRWDQALSRHRNTVIHRGYFEESNIMEIYRFIEHLRDVLTRVLLKMVCYVGEYATGTAKYRGTERWVGWVTETTDPSVLGYRDD